MSGEFLAGSGVVDISPPKGVGLGGFPHEKRENTGVHDPLYASCLYLENGATRLATISLDVVNFPKKAVREVRGRVAEKTGIPAENVTICCTHTHSAPWCGFRADSDYPGALLAPDNNYVETVKNGIVAAAEKAVNGAFAAEIGYAKGYRGKESRIGGNRLDPENGPCDPDVNVIGVKDGSGAWRTIVAKYAVHPTLLHADNLLVSADYPGYIRQYLAKTFPDADFLFLQGTSGDQSPRYFRDAQTFAEAERFGSTIGEEVARVLRGMTLSANVPLFRRSVEIPLDLKSLPTLDEAKKQVAKLKAIWEKKKAEGAPDPEVWVAKLHLFGAEHTLNWTTLRAMGNSTPVLEDEFPAEVDVIGIGDTRIVTFPGEIFSAIGLEIKKRAPRETFVVELANGKLPGYVCDAATYAAGGYEAGTSMMTPKSGPQLVDAALKLLADSK